MEKRDFLFEGVIKGERKELRLTLPLDGGNVITNQFCPPELIVGDSKLFVGAVHGEFIDDFVIDCKLQIKAMEDADKSMSLIDIHVGGLIAAVATHINRCGRLIFGDLLIYIDCFSHLLAADGFCEEEIKKLYPKITKSIVDICPEYVKNSVNLAPIKTTRIYETLTRLA